MRIGTAGTALGGVAIATAYGLAFFSGPGMAAGGIMAGGTVLILLSLFWIGARPRTGRRPVVLVSALLLLGILMAGCLGAGLVLGQEAAGSPLLLGLPRRAALLLYGIGALPALVIPVAYWLTFPRTGLDAAGLAEFRRRLAELRDEDTGPR